MSRERCAKCGAASNVRSGRFVYYECGSYDDAEGGQTHNCQKPTLVFEEKIIGLDTIDKPTLIIKKNDLEFGSLVYTEYTESDKEEYGLFPHQHRYTLAELNQITVKLEELNNLIVR